MILHSYDDVVHPVALDSEPLHLYHEMNISKLALIRFSDEFEVQVVELTSNLKAP